MWLLTLGTRAGLGARTAVMGWMSSVEIAYSLPDVGRAVAAFVNLNLTADDQVRI